jgi:hypothetical protein
MPKKTTTGGENLKARGLVGLLVPVTREVRDLVKKAAVLAPGGPYSNTTWSALTLEQAARQVLKAAGVDPDKP